ncbi:YcjX family protein [Actinobacillus equuli]|uniref:YcjX family protein n=1 Tax=Actinobacillus equuli TaxID=718 RepID=UPI002441132D|nr:YcjX family protein [Actinobacillus equuli]WGE43184.1 YcjX family protein [Actinobacillus equuli subsp. haemolyticus]WGE47555.1 YcjX family protein [Actinobacillus equuli subsp. haemolyticus]
MFNKIQNKLHKFVQRGLDNHLRLAVTGLSRSGKTAFITSFVDQLLHINKDSHAHVNLFGAARNGQILSVKRVEQGDLTIPRFEYDKNRQCLENDPPVWAPSTTGISEIRLAIRYQRQDGLIKHLKETGTLYLDIFDYPGEWLLDLPLLSQSFKQWSQAQQLVHKGKRAELAQPWLQAVKKLDLFAKADENQLAKLSEIYTAYLLECKQAGMQYIQPGRFVLPTENSKGAPVFQFFPLLDLSEADWEKLENSPASSTFQMLKKRYNQYQQKIVKPFYEDYFSQFDRQVILADCLTPLNHGLEAFLEMKIGLQQLFKHFHYGNRSLFHRLFSSNIDKLLFVATKADHITSDQLPNLESLMRQLVQEGGRHAAFDGIETGYHAISAIRATDPVVVTQNGTQIKAIRGIRSTDKKQVTLYPGTVPSRLPDTNYWQFNRFEFDQFEPKSLAYGEPIPHLRMDAVLQFLLADMLE